MLAMKPVLMGALLVAGAVGPDAPKPDELIRQLGSSKYSEREEASGALEQLGADALKALERASKESDDPEVRSRAAQIRDRIELALVTQPTRIPLDFQDRPLGEVIDEINAKCGGALARQNPADQGWSRPVTIREPDPLPFWQAVDRLCTAANLRATFGYNGMQQGRGATIQLVRAGGPSPAAKFRGISREGPFLSQISSLNYNRSVTLFSGLDPIPNPQSSVNFQVQMQVYAEPRLTISQSGPIHLDEAIDERGRSLLASEEMVRQLYYPHQSLGQAQLPVGLPLTRPDESSKSIARLRGTIPVQISTRRSEPMEVPLKDSAGKTFAGEAGTIVVGAIQPQVGQQPQAIELVYTPPGEPSPNDAAFANLHAALQNMLEVLDAKDRPFRWFLRNCTPQGNGSASISLYVTANVPGPQGAAPEGQPAKLLVYGLKTASTEVRFDFRDIPMP